MNQAYSGFYTPQNPSKYKGDPTKIVFRSSWELKILKYLDANPDVIFYQSEEIVIPYICKSDNRPHRYFPDFFVKFKNGTQLLIEVKPKHQTQPPKSTKGKREDVYIRECMAFAKNISKWEAAKEYCRTRGWTFVIFTEDTLKSMGMKFPSMNPRGKR